MTALVCERCGVSIAQEGCCIDGEFLCLPCWRAAEPRQQTLDLTTGADS